MNIFNEKTIFDFIVEIRTQNQSNTEQALYHLSYTLYERKRNEKLCIRFTNVL